MKRNYLLFALCILLICLSGAYAEEVVVETIETEDVSRMEGTLLPEDSVLNADTAEGIPEILLEEAPYIRFNGPTELTMKCGESAELSVETGAEPEAIIWSSDNERVAVVEQGHVTALTAGTCTIRAYLSEEAQAALTLTVAQPETEYAITYVLNGGTNSEENPAVYTASRSVTFAAPVREGYTFKGWYKEKDFLHRITSIAAGSKGAKKIYAKWAANKYTVVFDGNGALNVAGYTQKFTYGKTAALTANKFKIKGYTMTGWNTEPDGTGEGFSNAQKVKSLSAENGARITLYAQWQLTRYKITYVLNGGTNHPDNVDGYTMPDGAALYAPERTGYTFAGWYQDKEFKKKAGDILPGMTGNKTAYAKWKAHKYTVAFDGNGASNVAGYTQKFTYGKTAALTANKFKIKGYTMTGWNTEPDGTGTAYKNAQKVKSLTPEDGAQVTLYAQWRINSYKITYALNGGINSEENPAAYTVLDTVSLAEPSRTGYTFAGWYRDKEFKKKAGDILPGSTGNKTAYAKWTANKYSVVFDGNGAANVEGYAQRFTYGKTAALTANKFKIKGYTMTGWNTEPDGTGTAYKNAQSVKSLCTENGAKITLYAQWKINSYKITYKLNSGTNSADNPTVYTVLDTVTLTDPVRTGYTFKGWYKDSKYKTRVTEIIVGSTGAKTVYAKWAANHYTVTYDGNGATNVAPYSQGFTYGTAKAMASVKYRREGYKFSSWNTEPDGTGTKLKNKQSIKRLVSEDGGQITLYAQWHERAKTNLNGTDFYIIETKTDPVAFSLMSDGKVCQTRGDQYHGKCMNFAMYYAWQLRAGAKKISLSGATNAKAGGISLHTHFNDISTGSLSYVMNTIYNQLYNNKPVVLMVKATNHVSRHFITVVGYKTSVKKASALKPTDLLILDCHDGKLESMDKKIFKSNTRLIHTQEGKYRLFTLK